MGSSTHHCHCCRDHSLAHGKRLPLDLCPRVSPGTHTCVTVSHCHYLLLDPGSQISCGTAPVCGSPEKAGTGPASRPSQYLMLERCLWKKERGKGRKARREEGGSLLARGCPLLPRMFSMTLRGQCPHTRSFQSCKLSRSRCSSPECRMCQRPGARGPEPSSHLSCLAHRFVWESPGNRGPCCQLCVPWSLDSLDAASNSHLPWAAASAGHLSLGWATTQK